MMAPGKESAAGWTGRYEQLRRHALGEPAPTTEGLLGLEALLQSGMAIWMRAGPPHDTEGEATATVSVASRWLAAGQRETTRLLAEMTWPQIFQTKPEESHGE